MNRLGNDAEPRGYPHGADEGTAVRGFLPLVCNRMAREAIHLRERGVPQHLV